MDAAPRRYLIQRTFPAGALDGVNAEVKKVVNENNRELGVAWDHSYVNAEKTMTFCIYTGPNEAAVREAAKRNNLPIDWMTEIPGTLHPK